MPCLQPQEALPRQTWFGAIDCDLQVVRGCLDAEKTYGRVLGDIKMVLTHPPAIAALLLHDMPLLLNKVLGLVSNIRSYQRQLGMHIQWQDDSWLHPIQLEVGNPSSSQW